MSVTKRRRRDQEIIAALAEAQHGVVALAQLRARGVRRYSVKRHVKEGWLRRLHRGVYLVGPVAPPRARAAAAVLACGGVVGARAVTRRAAGPGAEGGRAAEVGTMRARADRSARQGGRSGRVVVSHRSAAVLWDLVEPGWDADDVPVDITAVRGNTVHRPGIRVHRVAELHPRDVTELDGVPITTAARTICDLAGAITTYDLERAVNRALSERITTREGLAAALNRYANRSGAPQLRALLHRDRDVRFTRSEAEARFLALLRRAGVPLPAVNVRVRGFEVDFFWRAEQVVVEVDGFAYHSGRRAFEADRRRDAILTAAGMRVIRVTWNQIVREPEVTAFRLKQVLGQAGSS